jgi:GDPmannose 4,6-dehydratase
MRWAFLTGTTGQGGSHLAKLLLNRGCEAEGLVRRASTFTTERTDYLDLTCETATPDYSCTGDLSDELRLLFGQIAHHDVSRLLAI